MSTINDGGPAFPRDERHLGHNGMTLRDYFAAKALAGLCANPGGPFQACDQSGWRIVNCTFAQIADEAYGLADSMLAARGAQ
ncbi:hypothetical protein [Achromobacter denitrificans]|uniref:hypothetical protein n=1 Tax=Achromobacter denitrificans TaxID=32002 RepID=UPI0029BE8A5B|nr:hypothetical protein [Achromobacter sp.]